MRVPLLGVVALLAEAHAWHQTAGDAVERFAEQFSKPGMKVLDVGGRNVNGGARAYFESRKCKFVCLDMETDPSVDVVSPPGESFPFVDGFFDLVVTTSTFEHDPMFWMSARAPSRLERPAHAHFYAVATSHATTDPVNPFHAPH